MTQIISTLTAGQCADCNKPTWVSTQLQKNAYGLPAGHNFLLWPKPDSLYARVDTPMGPGPGIGYCGACAPEIGQPCIAVQNYIINSYESAKSRYAHWYTEKFGDFLKTWLKDGVFHEPGEIDKIMAEWERDRA